MAVLDLHCFGFSLVVVSKDYCLGAVRSFLLYWLLTCVLQELWYMASTVAAQRAQAQWLWCMGLVAPQLCRIISDQGLNPCLLHWQADSLPLSHKGSPRLWLIKKKKKIQQVRLWLTSFSWGQHLERRPECSGVFQNDSF